MVSSIRVKIRKEEAIAEAIENCDFKTLDGAVYPGH